MITFNLSAGVGLNQTPLCGARERVAKKSNLSVTSCFSLASVAVLSDVLGFDLIQSHATKERAKVANLAEVILLRTRSFAG